MPFTPQQIQQLKIRCNSLKPEFVAQAVVGGAVTLDELNLTAERREYIKRLISSTPNAEEQAQWQSIVALQQSGSPDLERQLADYVARFSPTMPPQNHVEEARNQLQAIRAERDRQRWEQLDKNDYLAVKAFVANGSAYQAEAEDLLWQLAQAQYNYLEDYAQSFPGAAHASEAQTAMQAYAAWQSARFSTNPKDLVDFLRQYATSPYANQARDLLTQKKEEIISLMQRDPSAFKAIDVKGYLDCGIVSEQDLINSGVVNAHVIELIRQAPTINYVPLTSSAEIQSLPDTTDIYLFGVPSSGKTCVLSGLIGSKKWSGMDFVAYGSGNYINYLELSRRNGLVPNRTNGNFVALIKATVDNPDNANLRHVVNLIDMAGEDFADKIVENPEGEVNFEDMGIGVTNLMSNANRKVFFIVIDPSSNGIINLPRKDAQGNPLIGPDGRPIMVSTSQDLILRKMISMIMAPQNAKLLKRVDTIHFIMSKADMLGMQGERNAAAEQICRENYGASIGELTNLCRKYGINVSTDGHPMVHTFSLGHFYIGGVYDYDCTDSDKLVSVIQRVTQGRKVTRGFFSQVGDLIGGN